MGVGNYSNLSSNEIGNFVKKMNIFHQFSYNNKVGNVTELNFLVMIQKVLSYNQNVWVRFMTIISFSI